MQSDIHEIHETASTFIEHYLDEFTPFRWDHPSERIRRQKSFSELSMYWYVSKNLCGESPVTDEFVVGRVNDDRYIELLNRRPDRLTQNAFAGIAVQESGKLDPKTAAGVRRALDADEALSGERLPYEWVTLLTLRHLWGFETHPRSLSSAMDSSALAHPPDIVTADIDSFYRLTHDVMLPLAFGSGHPAAKEAPLPYDVSFTLVGGVLRAVAADDADAALELLLAGILQQQMPTRLVQHVFRWVRKRRLTDDYVVQATDSNPSQADHDGAPEKSHYPDDWGEDTRRWAAHYHANIVAGTTTAVASTRLSSDSNTSVSLSSTYFETVLGLGRALNRLSTYDLKGAAEAVVELPDEAPETFPRITERVEEYLRDQRHGENFGYWAEERRMFEIQHGETTGFERHMIRPVEQACDDAIESFFEI